MPASRVNGVNAELTKPIVAFQRIECSHIGTNPFKSSTIPCRIHAIVIRNNAACISRERSAFMVVSLNSVKVLLQCDCEPNIDNYNWRRFTASK